MNPNPNLGRKLVSHKGEACMITGGERTGYDPALTPFFANDRTYPAIAVVL